MNIFSIDLYCHLHHSLFDKIYNLTKYKTKLCWDNIKYNKAFYLHIFACYLFFSLEKVTDFIIIAITSNNIYNKNI